MESDQKKLLALESFKRHRQELDTLYGTVIAFALESIKSLLVLNGGGITIVALFFGFVDKKNVSHASLAGPFAFFVTGLCLAALTPMLAYCTQYLYGIAHEKKEYTYSDPFVIETSISKRVNILAKFFHLLTVTMAALSLSSFAYGAFIVWQATRI